jgi:hypothetical protein
MTDRLEIDRHVRITPLPTRHNTIHKMVDTEPRFGSFDRISRDTLKSKSNANRI